MKLRIVLFVAMVLLTAHAFAQEALVPLDSAGRVETISADMERKLGMFGDVRNFREAKLFQISDSTYVLEVFYQPQNQLLKQRVPLTTEDVEILRRKITSQMQVIGPMLRLNQDGRARFIVGTTTLSLLFYGWAVPTIVEVSSGTTAVAMYLIIGGGGYYLPYLSTQHSTVTEGMASFSWTGGSRGIADGVALAYLLGGNDPTINGVLASGLLCSVAEMFSFYSVAKSSDLSPGTAAALGVGGDYGLAFGAGSAALAHTFDGHRSRAAAGIVLLGHGAGLLAGGLAAKGHPYTKGDARVLQGAIVLGGGVITAAANVLGNTDSDVYWTTGLVGSAAGFGLGHVLTRDTRFTEGQGSLIALGELGGALMGTGIAYIIKGGHGDERAYTGLAAVGGTAGFWLAYKAFAPHAARKSTSWDLQVSPVPLLCSAPGALPRITTGVGAKLSF